MPEFPKEFPDNCPFPEAHPAQENVYRVVKDEQLQDEEEFKTPAEAGKFPKADACKRSGLSVLQNMEDAKHMRKIFPYQGEHIAEAQLNPEHGKTQPTKGKVPTHTTWWVYKGINRPSLFSIVKED